MIPQNFPHRLRPKHQRGFSLVEVTLAIGIVAFAFVALFGLVPTGLNVFRTAIDTSIGSNILQQVVENAQQTDYDTLIAKASLATDPSSPIDDIYYDEQGDQVLQSDGTPLTGSGGEPAARARAIYRVREKVIIPTAIPASTSDAGTATTKNVATVIVLIAKDPGHAANPFTSTNTTGVSKYIAYVSRNRSAL